MDAFVVEARLTGSQSHLASRHVAVAEDAQGAADCVARTLGIGDGGVRVVGPLDAKAAYAAGIDRTKAGYAGQMPVEP